MIVGSHLLVDDSRFSPQPIPPRRSQVDAIIEGFEGYFIVTLMVPRSIQPFGQKVLELEAKTGCAGEARIPRGPSGSKASW